jgi:preprotein translocase subunit YajC
VPLAATTSGANPFTSWILLAVFVAAAYFVLIRPQQRRRRQMQAVQSSIAPGDQVMTMGGLYGTVVAVDDETITLEVAPGVTNRYARQAVGQKITPPDEKQPADTPETSASDVVNPD